MKKLLLLLAVFTSICCYSQENDTIINATDLKIQQMKDSNERYLKQLEMKRWEDQNLQGLNYLMQQQEERRKKQKRDAMIRIGFGVAMLAILIIGLRRRSAKAKAIKNEKTGL